MLAEWILNIFNSNGEIRNCICYRVVMFFEHGMKVVEGVFQKRFPICIGFALHLACYLVLCLRREELILCLSMENCMINIMTSSDRCFKYDNIPKTEGDQIYLSFVISTKFDQHEKGFVEPTIFHREHALAYPQLQFYDMRWSQVCHLYHNF